jgi:hypothetical protein
LVSADNDIATEQITVFESTWLAEKSTKSRQQLFRHADLFEGRSFNMYNVSQSEEYMTGIDEMYAPVEMECILSVPIIAPKSQKVLGVLEFINKEQGMPVFAAEDESLLRLVSNFWVFLLSNVQLQQGSDQNQQMQHAFADVAAAVMGNPSNFEGLVDGLQAATCNLMRCEVAEFCSFDAETRTIRSQKPSEHDEFVISLDGNTIPGRSWE